MGGIIMLKKILFAVVLLVLSGILAFQYLFVDIPVAVSTLSVGAVVTAEDLTLQKFFISNVSNQALKTTDAIIGKTTLIEVGANSYFLPYALSAESTTSTGGTTTLDADHILVSLIVKPENIPTTLQTGDTVNVVAYFSATQAGSRTPFAISFPYEAKVQSIKKDDAGKVSGVDVVTSKLIGTELSVASLQGTIALIEVAGGTTLNNLGTSVDDIYTRYFYGNVAY